MQGQQDDGTVNATAIVLAAAARATTNTGHLRLRQELDGDLDHASCAATKKTRWWSRLKAKLACFRPHGHPRRIVDASLEPGAEHAAASSSTSSYYHTGHAPQPALAFVAPPPSPASSTLTWGSPSPAALQNASSISSYSSPTVSIFAVGPYAREPQQLVSPPAFSAGLTEPSTAPLTPPAESTTCSPHLLAATTPSSPEVPFARFVWPSIAAADQQQQQHCSSGGTEGLLNAYYQMQPGSPILVSPGSTSSSPPSWTMQRPVRARNEVLSLLDGARISITEEGGDCGSVSASRYGDTHEDEMAKSGGDFVFGNNADAAAGAEVGGGGSLALGGATEQWPFHLAHG